MCSNLTKMTHQAVSIHPTSMPKMNRYYHLDLYTDNKQTLPKISSFLSLSQNSNTTLRRILFLICELHEINICLEILAGNVEYSQLICHPGAMQSLHILLNKLSDKVQKCLNDAIEEDQRASKWTHTNVTAPGLLNARCSVHFQDEAVVIEMDRIQAEPHVPIPPISPANDQDSIPAGVSNKIGSSFMAGCFRWLF